MSQSVGPEWNTTRSFGNEDRLPRVPLPTLEATCDRFLEWCAPLLTAEQYVQTAAEVAAFRAPDGPGPRLHAALERYNASPGVQSWLDTFWPRRYLGRRDRIALNANFFFLFQDADPSSFEGRGPLERAAGLIAAAVGYKLRLDQELIPPIIQRGQALAMGQNKFLFSETRIPGPIQDTVRVPYTPEWPGPSQARHIVVFYRGNMLRMEVIGPEGRPYTLDDLVAGLQAAMKVGSARADRDTSVGHLTTKARAEWAASRQQLLAHPSNVESLDVLETALFCVCLEEAAPTDTLDTCDLLLHGDSGNRWFDKSVSFIVFANGQAGINVEHCGLDGTTTLAFTDTMLATPAEEQSRRSGAQSQGQPPVAPIEFVLSPQLRADIDAAAQSFADFAAATASATVVIDDFGTGRAKQLGMSPDAFTQMAYQVAHSRAQGFVGATYESIATRQYQNGRTEAMRVVTPEVLTFVSTMDDPDATVETKRVAFRAAAEAHVRRARQCQAGDAPEQHLWELLLIQGRQGVALGVSEPPALYRSPGWLIMRDDYLSTSSAPTDHTQFFGFGSTSSHCIGVAYLLLPDRFRAYLSTPRSMAAQMYGFADQLRTAISQLQDLLA
jgi:carnitine O-acetyltransferase